MGVVPQLDFSLYLSQAFWFCCAFLLLYSVVRCLVVPRVEEEIRSRLVSRSGTVGAAARTCEHVVSLLNTQKELLDGAQARAHSLVQDEMERLDAAYAAAGALLDGEIASLLEDVDRKLEELKKRELEDVVLLASEIASMYYAKISGAVEKTKVTKLKKLVAGLYEEKL